jgi:hypothetical protein
MTKLRNLLAIQELNIKTLCRYERIAEMTNYSLDLYNLQMQKQKVKDIEDEILDLFKAPKSVSEIEQGLADTSDFLAIQIEKLNDLLSNVEDEDEDEEEEEEEVIITMQTRDIERLDSPFECDRN